MSPLGVSEGLAEEAGELRHVAQPGRTQRERDPGDTQTPAPPEQPRLVDRMQAVQHDPDAEEQCRLDAGVAQAVIAAASKPARVIADMLPRLGRCGRQALRPLCPETRP